MHRKLTRIASRFALGLAVLIGTGSHAAQPSRLSDRDIIDAYHYFLGRLLVLRQEHTDLKGEFKWNQAIHRDPGGVAGANPEPDVAHSEAWIAVDKDSCTIVELPVIRKRYYTVQVLNAWGETVANINERNDPRRPSGLFGLCLKGAHASLPAGARRVELPGRKSRVRMRVELGADPAEAVRLQRQIKLYSTGRPRIEPAVEMTLFGNDQLPRVEAFNRADAVLASEPDINPGMGTLQAKVRAIAKAARDVEELKRIDEVILKQAIPQLRGAVAKAVTARNGWTRPARIGNYGSDYRSRTIVNLIDIWANNNQEAVNYNSGTDGKGQKLDGSSLYTLTFAKGHPQALVRYSWSVIAVDSGKFQVIENPLKRYLLNNQSKLQPGQDGTLTLYFAEKLPAGIPESNWLPTPAGQNYHLTLRFYGPVQRLVSGGYFPPPLIRKY